MVDVEKLAARAAKMADEAEVFFSDSRETLAKSTLDKVNSTESRGMSGYGLRVSVGGRLGLSYFSREQDFERALERALAAAKHAPRLGVSFSGASRFPVVKGTFDKKLAQASEDELVDLLVRVLDRQKHPGIEYLENFLRVGVEHRQVATSNGCFAESRSTMSSLDAIVKSGEAASSQQTQGRGLVAVEPLIKQGIEVALKTRKASALRGGYDIYLHRYAIEEFLKILLLPAVDASLVARKQSPWHDKLGKMVAKEELSVYDDPLLPSGIASEPFDDEGTPSARKALIEKGVLRSFLSDKASAALLKVKPSGNGFRAAFNWAPAVAYTNLVFDSKEKERMAEANGVVVQGLMGMHTANRATGDFSCGVDQSWLLKDGEFVQGVRKCTLVGNFFEILESLRLADDDSRDSQYVGGSWVFDGKLV